VPEQTDGQDSEKPLYATGETRIEAMFRALIKGPPFPQPEEQIDSLRKGFLTYARSRKGEEEEETAGYDHGNEGGNENDGGDGSSDNGLDNANADRDAFRNMAEDIDSRPLCATQNGYFGLAPRDAQPGDKVAVLYGGFIPFVLRPQAGRGESVYTLVGHGYFHGAYV